METSGLRGSVKTLIQAIWIFGVLKQKRFAVKPLHIIPLNSLPLSPSPSQEELLKIKKAGHQRPVGEHVWKEGEKKGKRAGQDMV